MARLTTIELCTEMARTRLMRLAQVRLHNLGINYSEINSLLYRLQENIDNYTVKDITEGTWVDTLRVYDLTPEPRRSPDPKLLEAENVQNAIALSEGI